MARSDLVSNAFYMEKFFGKSLNGKSLKQIEGLCLYKNLVSGGFLPLSRAIYMYMLYTCTSR